MLQTSSWLFLSAVIGGSGGGFAVEVARTMILRAVAASMMIAVELLLTSSNFLVSAQPLSVEDCFFPVAT